MTSSISGILDRLGQKDGGEARTLDQITRVLEDLQCTTSTHDPEEFTFGMIYIECSVDIFAIHKSDTLSSLGKVLRIVTSSSSPRDDRCKIFLTVLLSFVDLRKMVEACRNEEVQCCVTI